VIRPPGARASAPSPTAPAAPERLPTAPSSPPPPRTLPPDSEVPLIEGDLFLTEPAQVQGDGGGLRFGGAGDVQPAGSWRSAKLYRDRLECWNEPGVPGKRRRAAPDVTIPMADIANAGVDTTAGTLSLTCRSEQQGSSEVRRARFDNMQELGKWSVAILGLIQRSPKEAPAARKRPSGARSDRRQPHGWVPRVARLKPKAKGRGSEAKSSGATVPVFRAQVHRSHRGFIVGTGQESDPSLLGHDFRGVCSAAKPMSDDLKNRAIVMKVNGRRASARIWPPERPLTAKINDQRVPVAKKGFTWSKITHAPDGVQGRRGSQAHVR